MKDKNLLSRENSNVVRGLAILAIMFHNFLHLDSVGFSKENEMSFSEIVSNSFFSKILSWDSYIIPEFVSFLGWTGVTVFVFFTGYGLMTKYPVVSNKIQFIKRNYIKLFWLLLPGLLFFFVVDLLQGNSGHFFRRLSYLTMLQNLDYPHLKVDPGVYWYFSLTFQLYLFYAIFNKWMKPAFLLICSALSLIVLYLLGAIHWGYGFSIFRHCFTGWFPVFAIGIYYAQKKISINFTQQPILLNIFLAISILAIMVLLNADFILWLFLPIVSLFWFFIIAIIIFCMGRKVSQPFEWIGKYSASIFVCHPIVRSILLRLHSHIGHMGIIIIAFFVLTLIVAFYYDKLYRFMIKRFAI